jgi:hypothetical protein
MKVMARQFRKILVVCCIVGKTESEVSMDTQQLESLYGPLFPYGDYKIGESIRFYDVVTNAEYQGVIVWVKAPGSVIEGGRSFPALYILDTPDPSTGFPWEVEQSDLIE